MSQEKISQILNDLYTKPCVMLYKDGILGQLADAREEEIYLVLQSFRPGSVLDSMTLLMLWGPLSQLFPKHTTVIELERVLRERMPKDPLLVGHAMFKKMIILL